MHSTFTSVNDSLIHAFNLYPNHYTGKKRKASSPAAVRSKKTKLAEVTITPGPECPAEFSQAAVGYSEHAYFANANKIHQFHVPNQNWMQSIECPQSLFGLAAHKNEMSLVGGIVPTGASNEVKPTNKIQSLTISTINEQKTWQEKYPSMTTARVYPQVVAYGKYLIVLGGWAEYKDMKLSCSMKSVEILDLEQKRWFSNDKISLPKEFCSAHWQSACICGNNLFIAFKHPHPGSPCPDFGYDAYPYYSLLRCSVENLLDIAKEDVKKANSQNIWQKLSHPHDVTYVNEGKEENDKFWDDFDPYVYYQLEDDIDDSDGDGSPSFIKREKYPVETEEFYYKCGFTLSCIDNHTLVTIGCKHIRSTTPQDLRSSLKYAYKEYKVLEHELYEDTECMTEDTTRYHDQWYIKDCEEKFRNEECHVHLYDPESDSWQLKASTPNANGASNAQPSVAVVDNKIVIVRNSNTVHTITFK